MSCVLVWFRHDLRLADNPALHAAVASGSQVVPVYVHAPEEEGRWPPGAASRAWLARSLAALQAALLRRGARLVLRQGDSLAALRALAAEVGAEALYFNLRIEPAARERDRIVAAALRAEGLQVRRFAPDLLLDPSRLHNAEGRPYRVFTPFWRAVAAQLEHLAAPLPAPARIVAPTVDSLPLTSLRLVPRPRWDRGLWATWEPGEAGAARALEAFASDGVGRYADDRDRPDLPGTSMLSPHLHFGEIGPRQLVHRVLRSRGAAGAAFLRQLGWREFCAHLLWHFPHAADADLQPHPGLHWVDIDPQRLQAWREGRTGVPIVDAGMRELWQTGWMHNRVRMIVASFLTRNLRGHWLHGARWFWDTLVDADLANNAMGWQWVAGTGADAVPWFRIMNPVLQGQRFDPHGHYVRRHLPELAALPTAAIHAPWLQPGLLAAAAPDYPRQPIVDLKASREAALAAWRARTAPMHPV
jgi:deoxyribodipyrimidine photo-lyase